MVLSDKDLSRAAAGMYDTQKMREQDFARFAIGLKRGCALSWVDADTVSIGAGTIWIEGRSLQNAAAIQIEMSDDNDREAGVAEAISTTYYVYIRQSRSNLDAFEGFFSTTAPDVTSNGRHPTLNAAYLGSVENDGSGDITDFTEATAAEVLASTLAAAAAALNSLLSGTRRGAKLRYVDATTVEVGAGSVWVNSTLLTNAAAHEIDLSDSDDRESGVSESANTYYYIYAEDDGAGGFKAYFSTTAPTVKGLGYRVDTGDAYLGAVFNDAASNIPEFYEVGNFFQFATYVSHLSGNALGNTTWANLTVRCPPDFFTNIFARSDAGGGTCVLQFRHGYYAVGAGPTWYALGHNGGPYAASATNGMLQANASSQIQWQKTVTGGAVAYQVWTNGWWDPFLP